MFEYELKVFLSISGIVEIGKIGFIYADSISTPLQLSTSAI
jgi:hypothetical protein